MTHAEQLATDIVTYVSFKHPDRVSERLAEHGDELIEVVNAALALNPPGRVMTETYRLQFLEGFVQSCRAYE